MRRAFYHVYPGRNSSVKADTDSDIDQLKGLIVRAAQLLFESGVMQPTGHANLSARLDGERMVITNRGAARGLEQEHLAVVSFDGEVIAGRVDPTTAEIVTMHAGVYRERDQAKAVIHTHSPYATAFAVAHVPLPCAYESLLRYGVSEAIPVTDWAPRGSEESVANIVEQLRDHPSVPAVLLGNHGLLAFGADPLQAAGVVMALEETAQAVLRARLLGGEKSFPPAALEIEQERMRRFAST